MVLVFSIKVAHCGRSPHSSCFRCCFCMMARNCEEQSNSKRVCTKLTSPLANEARISLWKGEPLLSENPCGVCQRGLKRNQKPDSASTISQHATCCDTQKWAGRDKLTMSQILLRHIKPAVSLPICPIFWGERVIGNIVNLHHGAQCLLHSEPSTGEHSKNQAAQSVHQTRSH